MNYYVFTVEQCLDGTWHAKVALTEDRSAILVFRAYPTLDEIQAAADTFVANEQKRDTV